MARGLGRSPWLVGLGSVVLIAHFQQCRAGDVTCEQAARAGDAALTVAVCRREHERTGAPGAGVRLANALRRYGEPVEAGRLARSLLATSAQSDAFFVLGKLATADKRLDDAAASLRLAYVLHQHEGRWREVAKDLLAAVEVATEREAFSEALELAAQCLPAAARADDPTTSGYCHVAAAHVMTQLGYGLGAERALAAVRRELRGPVHGFWVAIEEGNALRDRDELAQALVAFERALSDAGKSSLTGGMISAHLNLAEVHIARRDWPAAQLHLDAVDALVDSRTMALERAELRARILWGRGEPARAADELDAALVVSADSSRDDLLELLTLRADLALELRDYVGARAAALRAISYAELVRAKQPLAQLRSWVTESRRAPYDALFLAAARQGLGQQALEAFDRWRAAVADGGLVSEQGPPPTAGLAELARQAELLRKLAAPAPVASAERSLGEQATSPLLALVVAAGELWRLDTASGAGVSIVRVGRMAEFEAAVAQLRSDPARQQAARSLGAALIPDALAVTTDEPVRVALDAPLAMLPLAYAYAGQRPLVAWRPLVYVRRPLDGACAPRRAARGRTHVVADAAGDLPAASAEALELARSLQGTVARGAAATRAALWAAGSASLLHVAVHANVDDHGGVLELGDGRVSALEIAARSPAPRKVVLATCGSAISRGGAHSLAMAYLAAGAEQVVATTRPISDAGAAALAAELYGSEPQDLVRSLAAVQRRHLDDPGDLASFSAFGLPGCDP
jgi:tetratricopeptide (TPR) repeat protein